MFYFMFYSHKFFETLANFYFFIKSNFRILNQSYFARKFTNIRETVTKKYLDSEQQFVD